MKVVKGTFALLLVLFSTSGYSLTINGNDAINVNGNETWVDTSELSTLTAMSGSDISWLYGYDDSTINISAGDVSRLNLFDDSEASITYLDDLTWLNVYNDAVVNIYGSNFSYSNDILSGNWANGSSFSFWALGDRNNIILHTVTEPTTLALLVLGLGLLVRSRKT